MISVSVKDVNEYLDRELNAAKNAMANDIELDEFTTDKAIRLSTKIKTLNIVKTYINKEA